MLAVTLDSLTGIKERMSLWTAKEKERVEPQASSWIKIKLILYQCAGTKAQLQITLGFYCNKGMWVANALIHPL